MNYVIEPCVVCGATPNVIFDGVNYKVTHSNPCIDRGVYTPENWIALRANTITLKPDEYEVVDSVDSIDIGVIEPPTEGEDGS